MQGASNDGALQPAVDPERVCAEVHAALVGPEVVDVAVERVTFEIDQVEATSAVQLSLRVNASVRNSDGPNPCLARANGTGQEANEMTPSAVRWGVLREFMRVSVQRT